MVDSKIPATLLVSTLKEPLLVSLSESQKTYQRLASSDFLFLPDEPQKFLKKAKTESVLALQVLEKPSCPETQASKVLKLLHCMRRLDVCNYFERHDAARRLHRLTKIRAPRKQPCAKAKTTPAEKSWHQRLEDIRRTPGTSCVEVMQNDGRWLPSSSEESAAQRAKLPCEGPSMTFAVELGKLVRKGIWWKEDQWRALFAAGAKCKTFKELRGAGEFYDLLAGTDVGLQMQNLRISTAEHGFVITQNVGELRCYLHQRDLLRLEEGGDAFAEMSLFVPTSFTGGQKMLAQGLRRQFAWKQDPESKARVLPLYLKASDAFSVAPLGADGRKTLVVVQACVDIRAAAHKTSVFISEDHAAFPWLLLRFDPASGK